MSVQQVEQVSVFRIGVSGTSGKLHPVFVKDGKCFVCGANASSDNRKFQCIDAYLYSPREAQEIFNCAGSYVQIPNGNARVYACHEHTNNLMELCDLVKANGEFITTSIVRKAMDGAWFFEMPITFVVRQRTQGGVIELCKLQGNTPTIMAEVPFDAHYASQVTDWLSRMLSVCVPMKADDDFFPGLEEQLQRVFDQQAKTKNPK